MVPRPGGRLAPPWWRIATPRGAYGRPGAG